MWLYISDGFLSIVAHRDLPMHLLVRARHPEHIQALLPDVEQSVLQSADYPFRAVVHRIVVQRALASYMMAMEYDNFKNSITDEPYHDVCLDVWTTMWKYGLREGGL